MDHADGFSGVLCQKFHRRPLSGDLRLSLSPLEVTCRKCLTWIPPVIVKVVDQTSYSNIEIYDTILLYDVMEQVSVLVKGYGYVAPYQQPMTTELRQLLDGRPYVIALASKGSDGKMHVEGEAEEAAWKTQS